MNLSFLFWPIQLGSFSSVRVFPFPPWWSLQPHCTLKSIFFLPNSPSVFYPLPWNTPTPKRAVCLIPELWWLCECEEVWVPMSCNVPNPTGFKLQAYQLSFSTDTRYFKDAMEAPLLLPPKPSVSTERQIRDVGMNQLKEDVSKRGPERLAGERHYLAHRHMPQVSFHTAL